MRLRRWLEARCSRRERGTIMMLTSLTSVILITSVSFAVDLGNVRQNALQTQAAADAGATAGAQDLPAFAWSGCLNLPDAVATAAKYAASTINSTVPGSPTCASANTATYTVGDATITVVTPYNGSTTSIRVTVCRTVPIFFGGLVGQSTSNPCRSAAASRTSSGGRCGLCVLSPLGTSFFEAGGGTLTIANSDLVVNSTGSVFGTCSALDPPATHTGGGSVVATAGTIGGPCAVDWEGSYTPTPITEPAVTDPLGNIPQCPSGPGCPSGLNLLQPNVSIKDGTCSNPSPCPPGTFINGVLQPGVYHDVSNSANTAKSIAPGTYVITGDFKVTASASFNMPNVTLFFACVTYPVPCLPGQSGGFFDWNGGNAINMSAPTTGQYAGLAIFYDRLNASQSTTITTNAGSVITGTVYMLSAKLALTGGGGTMGSAFIVGTIKYTGGANVTVDPGAGLNATTSLSYALYQ